ncbi:MAG: HvfC/BufC family peptide modification chaperone [Myxococcaceae bacterium]
MKPALSTFFSAMEHHFFAERQPGRMAIYGGFVFDHVADTLLKLYPMTREALGSDWDTLATRYYATRPARHFEMNQLGEGFPSFLADSQVADFIVPLARFEWADFAVFAHPTTIPASVMQLTANPTLMSLESPFRLCPFVRAGTSRPARPEAGQELALLWRHPAEDRTYFREADDRALLVLKLAIESITLDQAVQKTGASVDVLRSVIAPFARDGMVVVPP